MKRLFYVDFERVNYLLSINFFTFRHKDGFFSNRETQRSITHHDSEVKKMDISTILIVILAAAGIGLTVLLFLEKEKSENLTKDWNSAKENIRDLNSQLETTMDRITNHQIELTIANSGVMSLHNRLTTAYGEIKNLKSELTATTEKRVEVSQSNAKALRQLHLSGVSLQTSTVALHHERKKSKQVSSNCQNLKAAYNNLYKMQEVFVEKSESQEMRKFFMTLIKGAADIIPWGGAAVDGAEKLYEILTSAGVGATEARNILAAFKSFETAIENLVNLESISISLPDQNIDDIPIALTEDAHSALNKTYEQNIMDSEKLDRSNLRDFSTDIIQRSEGLDSVKSLTEKEHYERIEGIFIDPVDLGIEYYDYHKTYKR